MERRSGLVLTADKTLHANINFSVPFDTRRFEARGQVFKRERILKSDEVERHVHIDRTRSFCPNWMLDQYETGNIFSLFLYFIWNLFKNLLINF